MADTGKAKTKSLTALSYGIVSCVVGLHWQVFFILEWNLNFSGFQGFPRALARSSTVLGIKWWCNLCYKSFCPRRRRCHANWWLCQFLPSPSLHPAILNHWCRDKRAPEFFPGGHIPNPCANGAVPSLQDAQIHEWLLEYPVTNAMACSAKQSHSLWRKAGWGQDAMHRYF